MAQQGSVYQRGDGYWVASVRVGSKKVVRYGKTEKDATRKLHELRKHYYQGTLAQPTKLTLDAWVQQWLCDLDLRPAAQRAYQQVLTPVLQDLGHIRLDNLTPVDLTLTYSKLARQGIGGRQ